MRTWMYFTEKLWIYRVFFSALAAVANELAEPSNYQIACRLKRSWLHIYFWLVSGHFSGNIWRISYLLQRLCSV